MNQPMGSGKPQGLTGSRGNAKNTIDTTKRKQMTHRKRESPLEQFNANPTLIGWLLLVTVLLGGVLVAVLRLPNPQEKVVKDFFIACQQGDYDVAKQQLAGESFDRLASKSTVRVPPGSLLPLEKLLGSDAEQASQMRLAPNFTSPLRFKRLLRQKDKNPTLKLVEFKVGLDAYTSYTMPFSKPAQPGIGLTLEGVAKVVKTP
ncbi:MAG: hypothetical protein ABI743_03595, partial [bacterium]